MALVIFFVPDPANGVAEMVRVVCRGGTVATYAWENSEWQEPEPAAPLLEGDDAAGCDPLGE
jgi:hypothetical protein